MSKKKTYKYVIELAAPAYPRHIADMLLMQGYFVNHLISVTDTQNDEHVYGPTYQVQDNDVPSERVLKHLEDETPDVW